MVIFIYRPEYYGVTEYDNGDSTRGMADLIIAKHRSGAVGEVRLRFVSEYARFENPQQFDTASASGGMAPNGNFDRQGGSMIVDSKMNDDNNETFNVTDDTEY